MPKANKLIEETSPYLLQHAYNPVQWQAWNEASLNQAKREDKPILLSIGYSACHWCHVMEHESFEDEEVADIMNANYVCIKLDREERPDIDQIYMDAIQIMGLNGGWPLNVFLMPDQKPFYGGTYFPKKNWLEILDKVAMAFQKDRAKLAESAESFANALNNSEIEKLNFGLNSHTAFESDLLAHAFQQFTKFMDWDNGGTLGAPKFPMPVIWKFILQYAYLSKNEEAKKYMVFTLNAMANGGIYDQIGGGFARYAVDTEWFAPHFEKMLYDNGQLVSLYAKAYRFTKNHYFKRIYQNTLDFISRELVDASGGFYSALDADSEGEEGKFYTWTYNEFEQALKEDAPLFSRFYNVKPNGNWEKGVNILFRHTDEQSFCEIEKLALDEFQQNLKKVNEKLLEIREKRIRPGLDDKILSGWNALMLTGICDAYKASPEDKYVRIASANYIFLTTKMWDGKQLYRNFKNDRATIPAYLEDYALCIQAALSYFEISNQFAALDFAVTLSNYCIANFFDQQEQLFYYTDQNSEKLIARKKEIFDNVIPSSNSVMAENLHWLGILTANGKFTAISDQIIKQAQHLLPKEPKYLANWNYTYSLKAYKSYDVVVIGENSKAIQQEIWANAAFNSFVIAAKDGHHQDLLLKGKEMIAGKDTIYVCENNACQRPVRTVEEAIAQMMP